MSSSSSCHFCARPNPAGSKFCNDCGEPLDLKPCKQCDAFNHVAVDRCYQCGTLFAHKQEALAVAETGVAGAVASPLAPAPRVPATRAARVEPALGPLEHTPVALSDRMEAYTERVAEHVNDAPPLMPFVGAALEREVDDDPDWVDPRRQWEARLASRARRRTHAVTAAVAAVLLCAIAAVGYVAYDSGWLVHVGAWARAAEQSVVASSSAMVGKLAADITRERENAPPPSPGASSAAGSAASGAAAADSATRSGDSPATASNPAIAQPASDAQAPLATKTLGDPTPSSGSAAPPSSPAHDAASPDPAQTTARTASATAGKATRATRSDAARRGTRDAAVKPTHPAPPHPAVDKDALATQRLIQRDLAGFLPPESPPPR